MRKHIVGDKLAFAFFFPVFSISNGNNGHLRVFRYSELLPRSIEVFKIYGYSVSDSLSVPEETVISPYPFGYSLALLPFRLYGADDIYSLP